MSRTELAKGLSEVDVFREFAAKAPLRIVPASIAKREPPQADVACHIEGDGDVAFELVEICDENIAQMISKGVAANGTYVRTSDPSRAVVKKKLAKQYPAETPVELLCYTDGRVVTPDSTLIPTLQALLEGSDFQFRRVWLLGKKDLYQLWPAV